MKKYNVGDVLIRDDGLVTVITREKERMFDMTWLYDYGDGIEMRTFQLVRSLVINNFYKKVEI